MGLWTLQPMMRSFRVTYDAFLSGNLKKYELPEEELQKALKSIEGFPKP